MTNKFAELRAKMSPQAQTSTKILAQAMHIRLIKREIERGGLESGLSEPLDMADLKRRLRAKKGSL